MVRRIALALLVCGLTATVASALRDIYPTQRLEQNKEQYNEHEHVRDKCGRFSEHNVVTKCVRCSVRHRSTSCQFLAVASKDVRVRSCSSLDASENISPNIVTGRTESHVCFDFFLEGRWSTLFTSRNDTHPLYTMLDPHANQANYFFPREKTFREPARCSRGGLREHWASDDVMSAHFKYVH
uniref:Secreted protein n=1 Tax=Timema bartmani TaxID=61472 RepID=A0A7R9ERS6_9NEOP|nr:unnamed protein product [Timema bartmani]